MANVIKIRHRDTASGTAVPTTLIDGELGFSYADNKLYIGPESGSGNAIVVNNGGVWGSITGTISSQTDLVDYIASQITGLDAKQSVRAATTANITLSAPQSIDGVSVVAGNRVLVKNQTTQSQNGIYVVAAGAWTRATDMDAWTEVPNAFTFVEEGTTQADTGWVCSSNAGGTLNTTSITWVQFSAAGSYSADGNGIELSGTTFSLELDGTTLSKSATGLKVNAGGITNTEISASAAIAWSKMANLTVSRALVSDTNGDVSASTVTSTEVGYLSGVTSAIQTQINNKPDTFLELTDTPANYTSQGGYIVVVNSGATALTTTNTIDGGTF